MTTTQQKDGKLWEEQAIEIINRAKVYIPKGTMDARKIKVINRKQLISYIIAEGYGK